MVGMVRSGGWEGEYCSPFYLYMLLDIQKVTLAPLTPYWVLQLSYFPCLMASSKQQQQQQHDDDLSYFKVTHVLLMD